MKDSERAVGGVRLRCGIGRETCNREVGAAVLAADGQIYGEMGPWIDSGVRIVLGTCDKHLWVGVEEDAVRAAIEAQVPFLRLPL